jgi:hypothetical protein
MQHFILFTGHMIDAKDRAKPRFPAYKEKSVRKEIFDLLLQQKEKAVSLKGIASGACGSDILFHELCLQLNIPTEIYLPYPAEEFKKGSVSFAGENWDNRFNKLASSLPVHILDEKKNTDMNVYEQTNEWMLHDTLRSGGNNMTLIAVWDGGGGDGKGGTAHMVNMAREKGAEVEVIDVKKIE